MTSAQNQTRRKMFLNLYVVKLRLTSYRFQLIGFETSQNGQSAVFPQQTIMQNEPADSRVEIIGNRVAMKIDDKNSSRCYAAHLAKNSDGAIVIKVMQRQRLNHVVERIIREREQKPVRLHRRYCGEIPRLIQDRSGGSFIQFQSD